MNIKKPLQIIREISATVRNWHDYAEDVHVASQLRDTIQETLVFY